jgi:hypothetical protein
MTTTTTFNYTGAVQQFTVPTGVNSIVCDVQGAQGGLNANGGRAQGTLAVTPGEILRIYVGGKGGISIGGFNGGGAGGNGTAGPGNGGGGASDIRQGGANLSNRKIVAGAGGGDANGVANASGTGGGTTGGAGTGTYGGGGGTPSAGGAVSVAGSVGGVAGAGASGVGGFGSDGGGTTNKGAGGGGGGYFGGAGGRITTGTGAAQSCGGGGSSFTGGSGVTGGSTTANFRAGAGIVTLTYNQPPSAPTLQLPPTNTHIDRTVATQFQWAFSDPDPSDTQSAADFRYRVVGNPTWTTVVTAVSGTANTYSVALNTFVDATQYEWQVQTYDNGGVASGWSPSSFFTAHNPPSAPTVTAPAGTITANPVATSWTISGSQVAYQILVVADNGSGTAVPTTVYADSGQVNSSSHASVNQPLGTAPQGGNAHVLVRYQQFAGVWSTYGDSGNLAVNVGPPGIPTLALTPSPATGAILVAITNPGTPNATTSQDLYRTNIDEVPMRIDYAPFTTVPTKMDTLQPDWPYKAPGGASPIMLSGMRGLNYASAGAGIEQSHWAMGRKILRMRCEFQLIGAGSTDGETLTLGAFAIFQTSATIPDSHGYLVLGRTTWSFNVCQTGAVTPVMSGTYASLSTATTYAAEIVIDSVNGRATVTLPNGAMVTGTNSLITSITGTYLGSGTAVAAGNTDKKMYIMDVWGTDAPDFNEIRISAGLGSGASFIDYSPASGLKYRYRSQAFAAFGGSASSL